MEKSADIAEKKKLMPPHSDLAPLVEVLHIVIIMARVYSKSVGGGAYNAPPQNFGILD